MDKVSTDHILRAIPNSVKDIKLKKVLTGGVFDRYKMLKEIQEKIKEEIDG